MARTSHLLSNKHIYGEAMHTVTITTKPETTKEGKEQKSRSFSAHLLCHICADAMWSGGQAKTDVIRPVWAMFADTAENMRAFIANMRSGRLIEQAHGKGYSRRVDAKYEFQKSAGYAYETQRTERELGGRIERGLVLTVALPELLTMDSRLIDPNAVQFVCITPRWWHNQHGDDGYALRFFVYVRSRTRRPVVPSKAFAQFLLEQAREKKIAVEKSKDDGFIAAGIERFLMPPLFVNVTQDTMDEFLAETVKKWSERKVVIDLQRSAA